MRGTEIVSNRGIGKTALESCQPVGARPPEICRSPKEDVAAIDIVLDHISKCRVRTRNRQSCLVGRTIDVVKNVLEPKPDIHGNDFIFVVSGNYVYSFESCEHLKILRRCGIDRYSYFAVALV